MSEMYSVVGMCPACGSRSLTLAAGGYVTCMRLECTDPEAATRVLSRPPAPTGKEVEAPDDVEREAALTMYFQDPQIDWTAPDVLEAAGIVAFRAGWRAARA